MKRELEKTLRTKGSSNKLRSDFDLVAGLLRLPCLSCRKIGTCLERREKLIGCPLLTAYLDAG